MAALMGGALLAIVVSTVTLVFGWATESEALIWTSIISSGLSAVLMALGYGQARSMVRSYRRGPRSRR